MAGGEGGGGAVKARELDQTPTWAVASVCAVIIMVSILLEKVLHYVGEWFAERRKKALFEALEKIKAELMVLGFISLLLSFGQNYITKICILDKVANTMLPCSFEEAGRTALNSGNEHHPQGGGGNNQSDGHGEKPIEGGRDHHRRLLWYSIVNSNSIRRVLSGDPTPSSCPEGKVSLVSVNGLHQLHIFIFFLAVFHVVYSCLVMALGRAKIRGWKLWEKEVATDSEYSNDPSKFRLSHETSFVREHTSFWNKHAATFYMVSFFRQFFRSVGKADYLAMRHGFITVHLAPGSMFNFQKYIKRSLEDDYKVVVGISPFLWASAVVFLLLNVDGSKMMFWISIAPPIIILALGTKLQAIITRMALEIKERHAVVQGMPLVHISDQHFWFGRPDLVLFLIHFTLFQNAFQITYSLWIWYEFGLNSCFHEDLRLITARLCIGLGVQILCSYITLPLYALVSQMGSQMKKTIFDEQTSKAIKRWQQFAKKKQPKGPGKSPPSSPPSSPKGSPTASSENPIYRFKTTGHSVLNHSSSRKRHSPDMEAEGTSMSSMAVATPITNHNSDLLTGSTDHNINIGEHQNGQGGFYSGKP